MNSAKTYVILINLSLCLNVFLYTEELHHQATSQADHVHFKPNKRHMHEKKQVKKEASEKIKHSRAARIHKKQNCNKISHEEIKVKTTQAQHKIDVSNHHERTHQNKIARHHKKEPEILDVKKETIFQKAWGTIKTFFSSKKTA